MNLYFTILRDLAIFTFLSKQTERYISVFFNFLCEV